METIKQSRAWRNSMLQAGLIVFAAMMYGNMYAQSTPVEICSRFETVLQDDLVRHGKLSRDSAVLFVPAKNQTDAFMQAQNICIKLGAVLDEKSGTPPVYRLAGGKVTLHSLRNDNNVYVVMYIGVNCRNLKIKEIRYVSLKAYGNIVSDGKNRR